MDKTRRSVLRALAASSLSPALVSARGLEAWRGAQEQTPRRAPGSTFAPPRPGQIRVDGNENPLGPGKAALDALVRALSDSGRYPHNTAVTDEEVAALLAGMHGAGPESVVLGAGSGEILRTSVRAFTSKDKALVSASPTFGSSAQAARILGHPVKEVPVDSTLALDLDAMALAARGSGLVYLCNPNNPTARLHGSAAIAGFVDRVGRESPETTVLIDEAYHDYVTDPGYESAIPLALENPAVVVTRTFSKAYGMAGLRLGYAMGTRGTIAKLARFKLRNNTNVLVLAAASVSLQDPGHIEEERKRNTEVRDFTVGFFQKAGYSVADSQANFVFVNLGKPAKDFREACASREVFVGRDFPPLEKTHVRVSIGTMAEMEKATRVFAEALGQPTTNQALGRGEERRLR